MNVCVIGGYTYFITFIDDHSRYSYVYLMKYKSESFKRFNEFRNEVTKQTGKSIMILWFDRGDEYLSHDFSRLSKREWDSLVIDIS